MIVRFGPARADQSWQSAVYYTIGGAGPCGAPVARCQCLFDWVTLAQRGERVAKRGALSETGALVGPPT
jgi:hypothetical protein